MYESQRYACSLGVLDKTMQHRNIAFYKEHSAIYEK